MTDTDKNEQLRQAVHAAADGLLARGIRPTLALIEAEVLGPRPRLVALLEEWVQGLQTPAASTAPGELATFERTLPGRASSRDYAAKMVEAALSAEEGARARRDADHAVRDKLDLEREIRRATEQLARLEARQQIEPFNLVITNSIRKTRDRLAEMEARRASISTVDTR